MTVFKTPSVVVGPDEALSLWQPLPSRGYVDISLMPGNMPFDTFSSGIQVMPPGCHVRQHAHMQNHELIFIYEGTGTCTIDDKVYEVKPGTTVLFGRHCQHRIDNTGTTDMKLFWVFLPPGLEDWFQAIGRKRTPGEPMPEAFQRPDHVGAVMDKLRFVPPPTP